MTDTSLERRVPPFTGEISELRYRLLRRPNPFVPSRMISAPWTRAVAEEFLRDVWTARDGTRHPPQQLASGAVYEHP
jgi:hypothetical protein